MATAALLFTGVVADVYLSLSVEHDNVPGDSPFFVDTHWSELWERARDIQRHPAGRIPVGRVPPPQGTGRRSGGVTTGRRGQVTIRLLDTADPIPVHAFRFRWRQRASSTGATVTTSLIECGQYAYLRPEQIRLDAVEAFFDCASVGTESGHSPPIRVAMVVLITSTPAEVEALCGALQSLPVLCAGRSPHIVILTPTSNAPDDRGYYELRTLLEFTCAFTYTSAAVEHAAIRRSLPRFARSRGFPRAANFRYARVTQQGSLAAWYYRTVAQLGADVRLASGGHARYQEDVTGFLDELAAWVQPLERAFARKFRLAHNSLRPASIGALRSAVTSELLDRRNYALNLIAAILALLSLLVALKFG